MDDFQLFGPKGKQFKIPKEETNETRKKLPGTKQNWNTNSQRNKNPVGDSGKNRATPSSGLGQISNVQAKKTLKKNQDPWGK